MTTIEVSTDSARLDVGMIYAFLSNHSYWVPGISRANVEICIEHSFCFGVYVDNRQVAFARLVTDYVRFAHLMDVFVLPPFRGLGYSKLLMRHILAHPRLATIVRFSLGTSDAHTLYGQFGFTAPANPERLMELIRPGVPAAAPARAD
jgi:GNAT superfamily N-acetyltransferase